MPKLAFNFYEMDPRAQAMTALMSKESRLSILVVPCKVSNATNVMATSLSGTVGTAKFSGLNMSAHSLMRIHPSQWGCMENGGKSFVKKT